MRSSALSAFRPLHSAGSQICQRSVGQARLISDAIQSAQPVQYRPRPSVARATLRPCAESQRARVRSLHWQSGGRARLSSRAYQSPNSQPVQVRNVRFKRAPFFSRRRFLKTLSWAATIYVLMRVLIPRDVGISIEIEEVDNEKNGKKKKGVPGSGIEVDDEEDEDEAVLEEGDIFIPFTRAVELPRTYYKGSDPEWQEFIKIANDEERRNKISDRLKQELMAQAIKKIALLRLLGSGIRTGQHWIDFHFPDGPPPNHEREGLMIGNGRIAWVSEIVDDSTHQRQSRLVWPEDTVKSAWYTGKMAGTLLYRNCMLHLGLAKSQSATTTGSWSKVDRYLDWVNKGANSPLYQELFGANQRRSSKLTAQSPQEEDRQTRRWLFSLLLPTGMETINTDQSATGLMRRSIILVKQLFKGRFIELRDSRKSQPPRGAVILLGLAELRGSKGRMLFDMKAFYDPKTDQFLHIRSQLRSYKDWSQRPKGGQ